MILHYYDLVSESEWLLRHLVRSGSYAFSLAAFLDLLPQLSSGVAIYVGVKIVVSMFWAWHTILGLGPPVKTKLMKYIPWPGGYLLLLNASEVTCLEQS